MAKFSANLGFLWTELSLTDAIRAAARAGFDAVECHLPYHVPAEELRAVIDDSGLPMLGLNTAGDETPAGAFGLAALPGREREARGSIDKAVTYAAAVGAGHVHVMAGITRDVSDTRRVFVSNLRYAAERAGESGVSIVIEPLNGRDAPGYFLNRVEQAAEIIESIGSAGVRLMFDCYHVQIMQGDLYRRFESCLDIIGHVQFAGVPDRHEPDEGEVAYRWLFERIDDSGYQGYLGAEYTPRHGSTEQGLAWMTHARR